MSRDGLEIAGGSKQYAIVKRERYRIDLDDVNPSPMRQVMPDETVIPVTVIVRHGHDDPPRPAVVVNLKPSDKADVALQLMIKQNYVPPNCQLDGKIVWALSNSHDDPCADCTRNRGECGGRPKKEEGAVR